MRTLKLSDNKIELVEIALQYYFKRTQETAKDPIFTFEQRKSILNEGNKMIDLRDEIIDRKLDV